MNNLTRILVGTSLMGALMATESALRADISHVSVSAPAINDYSSKDQSSQHKVQPTIEEISYDLRTLFGKDSKWVAEFAPGKALHVRDPSIGEVSNVILVKDYNYSSGSGGAYVSIVQDLIEKRRVTSAGLERSIEGAQDPLFSITDNVGYPNSTNSVPFSTVVSLNKLFRYLSGLETSQIQFIGLEDPRLLRAHLFSKQLVRAKDQKEFAGIYSQIRSLAEPKESLPDINEEQINRNTIKDVRDFALKLKTGLAEARGYQAATAILKSRVSNGNMLVVLNCDVAPSCRDYLISRGVDVTLIDNRDFSEIYERIDKKDSELFSQWPRCDIVPHN